MSGNKLPECESVEELVEFFDTRDMGEYADTMPEVHFDVSKAASGLATVSDFQAHIVTAQHSNTKPMSRSQERMP